MWFVFLFFFFFSSRRRHTRSTRDWSSDVCSSDLAAEAGIDPPAEPMVFTKFPSAITGPYATIPLPHGSVDFEAELVAVIGRAAYQVPESAAWSHVAGLTIGQDLSERETQLRPPAPQQYNL